MYFLNASHLKQFYSSELGECTTRQLQHHMHRLWRECKDEQQMALGFAIALWGAENTPESIVFVMPAEQGAIRWPAAPQRSNQTIVARDAELPLPDNSINRVILMHALEFSPNVTHLMKEIYRVLMPSGRVMLIAPNRMGLWARSAKSPFGFGRPFSSAELKSLLEDTQFTFRRHRTAMFVPPTHRRLLLKTVPCTELLGQIFLPMCGGVHLMEAEKQIYASITQPIRASMRMPAKAAMGAVAPKQLRE